MKYMNIKILTLMLSASVLLALSGCKSTTGTPSDSQLVGSGTPPVAIAKADPTTATIGDIVTVDGSASYDPDGEIVSYKWEFQDLILGEGVTIDAPTDKFAAGTYTITLLVTDNDGNTGTDSIEIILEEPVVGPTCLETAGFGTITLANGQVWLDRNLGASKVADDVNDTAAFGDLYQWGRAADGHEKRTSTTTQVKAADIVAGHGEFIVGDSVNEPDTKTMSTSNDIRVSDSGYEGDWVEQGVDDNGSKRYIGWKSVNSSTQVCPCGYIVPSARDFADVDDNLSRVAIKLNLTLAGYRNSDFEGTIYSESFGPYWTRTVFSESDSQSMYYGFSEGENAQINVVPQRMYGLPIRCINPSKTSDEEYIPTEPQ